MYVDDCKYSRGDKAYRRVLLREGYRENGKVKHRTIANISHCSNDEIEAVKIALKMKKNLPVLEKLANGDYTNGKMVGAVVAIYKIASRLGIQKVLGYLRSAVLVLWLVIARLIDQGSRLSAVRLAGNHAACEVLGLDTFNEDDLYDAMDWLYDHKEAIEQRLFRRWQKDHAEEGVNHIFLYDVTSSYLEGKQNELADFGYNRDQKKGKKQVVYGLLTDVDGDPIAIEAFKGNTKDNKTLKSQIDRLKERFGCEHITIVGDKGMIKSTRIDELQETGFHYITSITKAQIRGLVNRGLLQMELFDDALCEVEDPEDGVRYILRRNPFRVAEIAQMRQSKEVSIQKKIDKANQYLKEHPRAKLSTQEKNLNAALRRYKMDKYAKIEVDTTKRQLQLRVDTDLLSEASQLDGCYVIKTDLPNEVVSKELVHERYKALSEVESAFRIKKTNLDARPIYVRKKERTIAHLFIVMLAYKIERYFRAAWSGLDLTAHEGITTLSRITSNVITIGEEKIVRVPQPDKECKALLDRIDVILPEILPYSEVTVATRKKLMERRKNL